MNVDLSSLELPIFLRTDAPVTELKFMRFSRESRPYRMEQEPNGEILVMAPSGNKTASISLRITLELGAWADADGRGLVFGTNTGFTLPNGAVRAPDGGWVSYQQWNALTDVEQEGFAPLCPEFVIGVASPHESISGLQHKIVGEWMLTVLSWPG